MSETKNLLLCGVGGQGTILASQILTVALLNAGFDVKMSELHGMSQRGGTVTTQVRYGEKVYAPVIGKGAADILVSFEKMEALRYLDNLKKDGHVVVNNHRMETATTLAGVQEYPENVLDRVQALANTKVVDAGKIAEELGNAKCMNVVLLGTLVKLMHLEDLDWNKALEECVKPKFVELNKKALQAGINAVQ